MASEGIVREWSDDDGFGVIDSAGTPGGCWVHFSAIVSDGLGALTPGDRVALTYEAELQDGFSYRAVLVWPPGADPFDPREVRAHTDPSPAYRSKLTIRWDDGTVTGDI